MRVSTALAVALVAVNTAAAPTLSLISSILGLLTKDISALLSSLGIKIRTDGSSHGTTVNYHNKCPFSVPVVTTSNARFSHDIQWSKGVSGSRFVD
jgi:glucan 1,3-beta-glucosidase